MNKSMLTLFALLFCSCQKESEKGDHRIIKEEDFKVISITSNKRYFEQIINPSNIGLVGRNVLISEAWRVPEQHPRMHIIDSKDWAMVEQRAGRRGLKPVTLGALPVILLNALAILVVAALYAFITIPPTSTTQGTSHRYPHLENAPGTQTKTDP